ncbi:pyridoxamine 5'-phosphate oxidase family protein [Nocardioides sp.]|uniref:pyridoxamine 5'-phosphate oxidase family protein n=1 Tax=Nocardioides sp. TaxID=35761 RepID=UPI002BB20B88|nr:pyridoxamine 5'-phosphate oxidase family protein [Nocardioides sp.]HVX54210.1 pyridoxamine 5'-phosphate oxidase family protein [Nocardioides sp.]
MTTALSPTPRTRINRGRNRAVEDRERLHAFLAQGLVAHLGVVLGTHPVVLPTAYGVDPDGPDRGGTLYLHGSVAAGWLTQALEHDVCVTVTELDGLVAARSGFHHSMNYRSAVVIGRARLVEDLAERRRALDLVIDQMIPGRSATLREPTRKELAATAVLALPLVEASMKERAGDPVDDPADVDAGGWAGVIPVRRVALAPVTAADADGAIPADVRGRAAGLA